MNIRDLKYLVAVAELEHFGKAAQQCHVSQPTLSGQIKKLEAELGITLFERSNRSVMLTEIGHAVIDHAYRILREVDEMQELAENAQNPLAGKFRLGAFPTLANYIFPNLVSEIHKALPDLRLILREEKTESLLHHLHKGEIDAALLALPISENSLQSHKLFDDEFLLATPANHPLADYKEIEQSQLIHHKLLLLEEGHCLRDQSLDVCQLHGISEDQDFKATSLETLRQMVKAGTGITFIPKIAIEKTELRNPKESTIRYIPFTTPAPAREIGIVWRKTSAKLQIIEYLKTIL